MSDAITLVAIISGITALSVAVLSHIKHSECSKCLSIDTRTPPQTPHRQTELFHPQQKVVERQVEVQV